MVMAKVKTKDGVRHTVTKNKKGQVIVDHTDKKGGRYDKMNLTKVAGSKTVKEGVKATRKWHNENPQKKAKSGSKKTSKK
jgi:coenzyme F420-reducing hydrogenase beta subunit